MLPSDGNTPRPTRKPEALSWRIGLLTALLLVLLTPALASAHAEYLRSDPPANSVVQTAPEALTITFTEPVEARFLDVTVYSEAGQRVDRGDTTRLENGRQIRTGLGILGAGGYAVRWRAMGFDGHLVAGSFQFGVGRPASGSIAPDVGRNPLPEALIRWITLVAASGLIGGIFFRVLVIAPFRRVNPSFSTQLDVSEDRVTETCWGAFSVFLAASVVGIFAQALDAGAGWPDLSRLPDVLFFSRHGQLWMARMILLSTLGASLARVESVANNTRGERPGNEALRSDIWWKASAVVGGTILATMSLAGHAGIADPVPVSVAIDWIHLTCAVIWVGGLLHLAIQALSPSHNRPTALLLARRFTIPAAVTGAILLATGLYGAWTNVPSPSQLTDTEYGMTLLAKLGIVSVALALGAWHFARLRRVPDTIGRGGHPPLRQGRIGATLLAEAVGGVAVLGAVGLLVSLSPARAVIQAREATVFATTPEPGSTNDTLSLSGNAANYLVSITLTPPQPGDSTLTIEVIDSVARPVDDAVVEVRANLDGLPLSERPLLARKAESGRYRLVLNAGPGRWNLMVGVKQPASAEEFATFTFSLPAAGARDIVARADAAMNTLTSLRERQVIEGGPNGPSDATYAYVAPDRMEAQDSSGTLLIAALAQRFERRDGEWHAEPWPDPRGFRWPAYSFSQLASNARLLGIEDVDRRPNFAVTFADSQSVRYTLWIDLETFRISRERMLAPGHYMTATFFDYNTEIDVSPPDLP
ncbi:MAG: copper resistance protein CopC [Chloroflexi bacterium]|nr:copper resistance protein CopC [Chloroflexota bacterium]